MAERNESERPITAQGLVNLITPMIIVGALAWVGDKVEKSGDGLTKAQVELVHVKESLKGLSADQNQIMLAVGDMEVLRERLLHNNVRMNELSGRITALEKQIRALERSSRG